MRRRLAISALFVVAGCSVEAPTLPELQPVMRLEIGAERISAISLGGPDEATLALVTTAPFAEDPADLDLSIYAVDVHSGRPEEIDGRNIERVLAVDVDERSPVVTAVVSRTDRTTEVVRYDLGSDEPAMVVGVSGRPSCASVLAGSDGSATVWVPRDEDPGLMLLDASGMVTRPPVREKSCRLARAGEHILVEYVQPAWKGVYLERVGRLDGDRVVPLCGPPVEREPCLLFGGYGEDSVLVTDSRRREPRLIDVRTRESSTLRALDPARVADTGGETVAWRCRCWHDEKVAVRVWTPRAEFSVGDREGEARLVTVGPQGRMIAVEMEGSPNLIVAYAVPDNGPRRR